MQNINIKILQFKSYMQNVNIKILQFKSYIDTYLNTVQYIKFACIKL